MGHPLRCFIDLLGVGSHESTDFIVLSSVATGDRLGLNLTLIHLSFITAAPVIDDSVLVPM